MTSIRQLFSLQELDLVLDKIQTEKSGAEQELNARLALAKMESDFESDALTTRPRLLIRRNDEILNSL